MARESGLEALWETVSDGLAPDVERMLLRLIKAHVRLLAELVRTAEDME